MQFTQAYFYFYGETSPTVSSNAFAGARAASVMTLETYQNEAFGNLNVTKGTTIDGCHPIPNLTFTPSNVFTLSNTFTSSSTFTLSLQSGATFTNTFILTHSLSLTQAMSICNSSLSVLLSITAAGSGSTFIQTVVVYYAHTAIAYSIYISYYISAFTVHYPSEFTINGSNRAIISACAAAAAVVLVVILIQILCRKQGSIEHESDNLEQYDMEATNIFSGVLSVSNIKEEPFAEDFKEDKFVNKI